MTVSAPHSRRGRQAEGRANDERVLDAARVVFAAQGTDASMAEIADRAGIGVGGLYRRYGSKDDLLRQICTAAMRETARAAEAALRESDPWAGLTQYVRACVAAGTGALAPLAGTVRITPDMRDTARHALSLLDTLVTRAREAGQLRRDATATDIACLIELLGRQHARASDADDDAVLQRLLAIALDGLQSTSTPLPAPAPDARYHQVRWDPAGS